MKHVVTCISSLKMHDIPPHHDRFEVASPFDLPTTSRGNSDAELCAKERRCFDLLLLVEDEALSAHRSFEIERASHGKTT